MEGNRLESAVDRIGTAMDRLEAALQARPVQPSLSLTSSPETELISQHEAMKAEVRDTLAALDDLISGLET